MHLNSERTTLGPEKWYFYHFKGMQNEYPLWATQGEGCLICYIIKLHFGQMTPVSVRDSSFPSSSFPLSLSRCFLPPLLISLPSSFLPSFHSTKTYWVPNEWTSLCPREQVPSLLGLRASRSHGGKTLQQKRSHSYRSARPELSANERGLRSCSARPSDWPWAKLGWTRSYLFPPL